MFFDRFKKIVDDLKFEKISLKSDFDNAAEVVLQDKRHLDNNPKKIMKEDIINMLKLITKD